MKKLRKNLKNIKQTEKALKLLWYELYFSDVRCKKHSEL